MATSKLDTFDEIDRTLSIECCDIDLLENCSTVFTDNHDFKILAFNIRSIRHNFDLFMVALKRLKITFDIIILTECWLSENPYPLQMSGFSCFSTTRIINQNGGVVAYVNNLWSPKICEPEIDEAECLLVALPNIKILGIYRSPSFKKTDKFLCSLHNLLVSFNRKEHVLVTGDININILESSNVKTSEYLDLMAELDLQQAISVPTRLDSCLDHIFIRADTHHIVGAVCKSDITDHNMILLGLSMAREDSNSKQSRRLSKINFKRVSEDLAKEDWNNVLNSCDVNLASEQFNETLQTLITKHCTSYYTSRSKQILKPWITPGLKRCMLHRDKLHLDLRKFPNDPTREFVYKRYRNFCNNLLHKLKCQYQSQELQKNKSNPKNLWKSLKNICSIYSNPSKNSDLLSVSSNANSSLNFCNEYFANVGNKFAQTILNKLSKSESELAKSMSSLTSNIKSFFLHPTNTCEVDKIITQLKNDSAPGIDGIQASLIKSIKSHILEPLTYILNLSLSSGVFPTSWKTACVIPIHKSGCTFSPENYRPISLLTIFSKILEKIVNNQLIKFISTHLHPHQFGFRPGYSTEDAVLQLTNKISSILDDKRNCIAVFLDLAKAFDTVSIPLLLKKLEYLGIRGLALEWFRSYLTNRSQVTKIDENISINLPITFGVPQGSVLGPTLFIIYVNDLISLIDNNYTNIICYADDTALIFDGDSWSETSQRAEMGLKSAVEWLNSNLLTLNTSKTKFLCFHKTISSKPKSQINLKIHAECNNPSLCHCPVIEQVRSIRYLGVIVDDKLSFNAHISGVASKVRKLTHVMYRIRDAADPKTALMVYTALCESIITYCITSWGGSAKTSMLELERAQRAVLKVLLKRKKRFSTFALYSEAGVLSVRQIFILRTSILQHKAIAKNKSHQYFLEKRKIKLPIPRVNSSFAQRFMHFIGPYIYNIILEKCDIKLDTIYKAKIKLKSWLLKLTYEDTEGILKRVC